MPELKSCPFCGSSEVSPSWCENVSGEVSGRFVECETCAAAGPLHPVDESKAITAWNRRVPTLSPGNQEDSLSRDPQDRQRSALDRTPTIDAELVERVYGALERAWCKGREGPYGLYDYTSYGWSTPHHVRDFRDPSSATYGECAFRSDDPAAAEAEYERLNRLHIVTAIVGAAFGDRGPIQPSTTEADEVPGTPYPVDSEGVPTPHPPVRPA